MIQMSNSNWLSTLSVIIVRNDHIYNGTVPMSRPASFIIQECTVFYFTIFYQLGIYFPVSHNTCYINLLYQGILLLLVNKCFQSNVNWCIDKENRHLFMVTRFYLKILVGQAVLICMYREI